MPNTGTKGGRILTLDICSICFSDTPIVPVDEIRTKRDLEGKNPLLVCRYCFDSKVEIPTSGGREQTSHRKNNKRYHANKECSIEQCIMVNTSVGKCK